MARQQSILKSKNFPTWASSPIAIRILETTLFVTHPQSKPISPIKPSRPSFQSGLQQNTIPYLTTNQLDPQTANTRQQTAFGMQSLPTRFVAGARFLFGCSILLLTNPALALFKLPTSPVSTYPYRLFGVRDAVIGGLLWTANTPELLKQALLVGTLIDSVDLLSTCAAMLSGDLGFPASASAVGGIVVFIVMELWALSGLRSQRGAKMQ